MLNFIFPRKNFNKPNAPLIIFLERRKNGLDSQKKHLEKNIKYQP